MGEGQHSGRLRQLVAEMVVLEHQIEEAYDQWFQQVHGHAEAAEAIRCFQAMSKDQLQAMQACLQRLGGSEPGSISSIPPFDMTAAPDNGGPEVASRTLHAITTAFDHAAFGYAILHTVAHRFNDRTGDGNAADMAEQHQRSYLGASISLYQLVPDVVIREMGRDGECTCTCPSCGLGICLCWHAHIDSLMPLSPAEEGGILVRSPRANSAAILAGLRQGDVILAADGQQVQHYQEFQAEVRKGEPGEGVRLRVRRGSGEPFEVTVTRL